jgi:hypothetical protein
MHNATQLTASTFGAVAAVAALEHGIGEVLQGNIAPRGIMILSWPNSAFFQIVAGEPALTLIPNLRLSGIATIFVALVFLGWVTVFIQSKHGGRTTLFLSIVLLLIGGGFGPPILGIISGSIATRINAPLNWSTQPLLLSLRRLLAAAWPWVYVVALAAWLFLFPGINLLAYYWGLDDSSMVYATILFAFGALLLTLITALAHDSRTRPHVCESQRYVA